MKKLLVVLPCAAALIAAGGVALAATTTSSDVQSLEGAESHVVSVLHSYNGSAAWKAEFKSAEAAQAADLARLNAALSPPTPGAAVFSQSGSGQATTAQFKIPSSAGGWHMNYSYDCASYGSEGNFVVYIDGGSGDDDGPDALGTKGSGVEHYYDTGTFHLEILSECSWSVQVFLKSQ